MKAGYQDSPPKQIDLLSLPSGAIQRLPTEEQLDALEWAILFMKRYEKRRK